MEKKKESKISMIENATTKEAAAYCVLYAWVIVRNLWTSFNRTVHRFPWVFMAIVIAGSTLVSVLMIGSARAERDSYNQRMVQMDRQLSSYKAMYDGTYKDR